MSTMNDNLIEDVWESGQIEIADISESDSQVDGKHIIGRVVGECFFPGKSSRNKRFYSEKLWETVLKDSELTSRLQSRAVFGTVGHEQPVDDKAVLEGKISHIVSKLWINENNKGMGEFLILGTPAGTNLYTVLKAGGKIHFSTRATGKYESAMKDGNNILAIDGFKLHTIDFVTNPGFLEAKPSIIESESKPEEFEMSDTITKEFVDHLKSENLALKTERDSMLVKMSESASTVAALTAKLEAYERIGTVEQLESTSANSVAGAADLVSKHGSIEKVSSLLEEFSKLGTPAEIDEALESAKTIVTNYNKIVETLGTPDKIEAALKAAEEFIESSIAETKSRVALLAQYEELGSVEDISRVFTKIEENLHIMSNTDQINALVEESEKFIKEYGTFKEIASVLDHIHSFVEEYGSISDIKKVISMTEAFIEENGSFEDVTKVLQMTEAFIEENGPFNLVSEALNKSMESLQALNESAQADKIAKLAEELKVKVESVKKLVESGLSEEDIRGIFTVEAPAADAATTEVPATPKEESRSTKGASYLMGGDINESKQPATAAKTGALVSRLFQS